MPLSPRAELDLREQLDAGGLAPREELNLREQLDSGEPTGPQAGAGGRGRSKPPEVDRGAIQGTLDILAASGDETLDLIAGLVGFPVDVMNAVVINTPQRQRRTALAGEKPPRAPVGGSISLRRGISGIQGVIESGVGEFERSLIGPRQPLTTPGQRIASRALSESMINIFPVAKLVELGQRARTAASTRLPESTSLAKPRVIDPVVEPFKRAPVKSALIEEGLAATAGTAGGIVHEVDPNAPLLELGAEVAASVGVGAVGAGARRVGRGFKPFTAKGQESIAAKTVQGITDDIRLSLENLNDPPPLPDGAVDLLTSAQRTADPGIGALERGIVNGNARTKGRFANAVQALNNILRNETEAVIGGMGDPGAATRFLGDKISSLKARLAERIEVAKSAARQRLADADPNMSRVEASEIVRAELDEGLKQARIDERSAWKAIYGGEAVNTAPIRDAARDIKGSVRKADNPKNLPKDVLGIADPKLNKKTGEPLNKNALTGTDEVDEILAFRSRLLEDIRAEKALDAPNRRKIANLEKLQEASLDALGLIGDQVAPRGKAIRAALDFSRDLNNRFTRGPVGELMGFRASGAPRVRPGETLDRILRADTAGELDAQALLAAVDSQTLRQATRQGIVDLFMRQATKDGTVDANAASRFLVKYEGALKSFPEVRAELADVTKAQRLADSVADRAGKALRDVADTKRSRTALFLEDDPEKSIQRVLSSKKQGEGMAQLVRQAKLDGSGQALEGLKRIFYEQMIARVAVGTADTLTSGPAARRFLGPKMLTEFTRKNSRAMKALYSPEELKRLDQVVNGYTVLERSFTRSGVKAGSDTALNQNVLINLLSRTLAGTAGAKVGKLLGFSPLVTAGVFAKGLRTFLRQIPEEAIAQLIEDAIFDSDVMRTMLMRNVDDPQVIRRLRAHLLNNAVVVEEDEQPNNL